MFISWFPSPTLTSSTTTKVSTDQLPDSVPTYTTTTFPSTTLHTTVSTKLVATSPMDAVFTDKSPTDLRISSQSSDAALLVEGQTELSEEFRHQLDEWARSTSVKLEEAGMEASLATERSGIMDTELALISDINAQTTGATQPQDATIDKYFESDSFHDNTIFTQQQSIIVDEGESRCPGDGSKASENQVSTEASGTNSASIKDEEKTVQLEVTTDEPVVTQLLDSAATAATEGGMLLSSANLLPVYEGALDYSNLQSLPTLSVSNTQISILCIIKHNFKTSGWVEIKD